ncbi:MAG TPA: BamA/TamA family outer membrane protein [Candidatus Binatia bacterium]
MTTPLALIFNRLFLCFFVAGGVLFARPVFGIQVEELDAGRPWRVEKIEISGNTSFSGSEILRELLTKVRPWYLFWEAENVFDPITFREDLERIRRFYEARGYYQTHVTYDLTADPQSGQVEVKIEVFEGPPVIVSDVHVEVSGGSSLSPPQLPLKQGEIFVEESYRKGEETLRNFFLEHGYAHVTTERRAEVNLDQDQVIVWYQADPGPLSVFGATTVAGTDNVDPEIVLRELSYQPGEIFSPTKIAESQAKILALDLFGLVRIVPKEVSGKPSIVPMEVQVSEKEPREIRVGIGYGTEDQFRAQLRWQHNNWLGNGRRLSVEARYSSITTTGAITLVQPHFFSPRTRGILSLRQDREDEDTYLLNASRFNPRVEHGFTPQLVGFIGYRLEYDRFDRIGEAAIEALGGVRERGLMSGPNAGLVWNTSDGPLNPTKGEVVTFNFGQAGKIWGGQYSFYKVTTEAKKYLLLGWETILAGRLKIGFAEPLGPEENLPISERLYAGGEKSVRGYARRKLGPLDARGNPIGGLSLIEGSVELRRPIWGPLGGALFIDFGQVSLRSFDLPVNDLKFGSGFGLNYQTPLGPLALYLGFPWRPPRGEASWQIYFSVGAYF